MNIIPDFATALVLTIPFLVTYAALHFILLKPLYAYMEERDQVAHDALAEASSLDGQIADQMATLKTKLASARDEATNLRAEARQAAQAAEAEAIAAARAEADAKVAEALRTVAGQRDQAATALEQAASQLSQDIASSVLGREVQA